MSIQCCVSFGKLTCESLVATETVTLFVGPKRKGFVVHRDLLCYLVPYFSKTFEGAFHESSVNETYLKEEDPSAVELFIGWLYRGKSGFKSTKGNMVACFNLYVMADKWCLTSLRNSIMEAWYEFFCLHSDEGLQAIQPVVQTVFSAVLAPQILLDYFVRQTLVLVADGHADLDLLGLICMSDVLFAASLVRKQCDLLKDLGRDKTYVLSRVHYEIEDYLV